MNQETKAREVVRLEGTISSAGWFMITATIMIAGFFAVAGLFRWIK